MNNKYENNEFSYFGEDIYTNENTEEKDRLNNEHVRENEARQKKTVAVKKPLDVKRLVGIAMFSALSYGVTFVFRLPVSFLTFDAKDSVLTVAAFIYGPLAAIIMSGIAAMIEFITISGTGLYGLIMNFASSAAFSATAALIYKYRRSFSGAIISIYAASAVTVALMMCLNLLVTPYYMGVSTETVKSLIPSLLLPFNTAKVLMNSALAMLLYKPVSQAMYRARLIKGKSPSFKFNKHSVILLAVFTLTFAAAVVLFVLTKSMN